MTVPVWLRQAAIVLMSTMVGFGLGCGLLCASGPAIDRHLAAATQPVGTDVGGVLLSVGHNLGQIALVVLVVGMLMIATVLGGLMLGLALSQRLINDKENDIEGETQTL